MKMFAPAAAALALMSAAAAAQEAPLTPDAVIAAAPAEEWRPIASTDLLVMDLAADAAGSPRRVVIQLLPAPFSAGWTSNIRQLVAARWWDGTSVYRVVDNWVAQWGGDEEKPLPPGLIEVPEAAYVTATEAGDAEGRDFVLTPEREEIVVNRWLDPYAVTGFVAGWPVGLGEEDGRTAWPVHCYGAVGVARDLSPDTGSGSELYAVIGHAPRQLDRNIAVVGRVIEGIEHLATLPRGRGEAGVYADPARRVPILSVRMASDLPEAERPSFEYLDTASKSFARYLGLRANRKDSFYQVPAGGVDVCNAPVPIRKAPE
ncbi:peptidylprolyl isomerase [Altererythrobacter sp. B11]|uniref:peptidylprolyl isomerase n=1 Tax=Altererythrobacter sp. B11 TaxID=2060312 RepID=UPI000DC702BB|nr:peptidylprolyl isomerase [Altererythrobacter sp. B11]BBC74296.1 peptidylprolyl isomerase [Altererythrobacter sp. B11]